MTHPGFNFLQITVSEIWPRQDYKYIGHYSKIKGQIKVTPLHCIPTVCLQFLKYSPDKIFKTQGHYDGFKGQIEVIP